MTNLQGTMPQDIKREAKKNLGIFFIILTILTSFFISLMANLGHLLHYTVIGVMWTPGVAALLTCIIVRKKISTLPWKWGSSKVNLFAWWLPFVYGLIAYVPIWLFNLGGSSFPEMSIWEGWSYQVLGEGNYNWFGSAFFVFLLMTIGVVQSAASVLGEEIGWRGFLIWEMRKITNFTYVSLFSGVIWTAWHVPAILLAGYNNGDTNLHIQIISFTTSAISLSFILAYLTFKTKSMWPAIILHSSSNLFIQKLFTPITSKGNESYLFTNEFGVMMAITLIPIAFYFWRLGIKENL